MDSQDRTLSGVITLTPCRRQIVAEDFPALVILAVLLAVPGVQGLLSPSAAKVSVTAALVTALFVLCRYLRLRFTRYDITDEQISCHSGVLTRRCDYIELYRVTDYEETRGFLQLLLGLKTVIVRSGDPSLPKLVMAGVPSSAAIVPLLRTRVEYNKKRRSIYEITNR